jgi:elongation factor 1-beta
LVFRYTPSQADVIIYKALGSAPGSEHPNALRWYNHITSYAEEHSTLPGDSSKSATDYFPEASTSAPAKAEDDDDVDLFGSDEEEDEEAEKLKAQRLAEYNAKKAAKPKPVAKVMMTFFPSCQTWLIVVYSELGHSGRQAMGVSLFIAGSFVSDL